MIPQLGASRQKSSVETPLVNEFIHPRGRSGVFMVLLYNVRRTTPTKTFLHTILRTEDISVKTPSRKGVHLSQTPPV